VFHTTLLHQGMIEVGVPCRLGLQADAASGGGATGPLKSFDPLFPKNAYFVRGFRAPAPRKDQERDFVASSI